MGKQDYKYAFRFIVEDRTPAELGMKAGGFFGTVDQMRADAHRKVDELCDELEQSS